MSANLDSSWRTSLHSTIFELLISITPAIIVARQQLQQILAKIITSLLGGTTVEGDIEYHKQDFETSRTSPFLSTSGLDRPTKGVANVVVVVVKRSIVSFANCSSSILVYGTKVDFGARNNPRRQREGNEEERRKGQSFHISCPSQSSRLLHNESTGWRGWCEFIVFQPSLAFFKHCVVDCLGTWAVMLKRRSDKTSLSFSLPFFCCQ
jgi:hypothetical protein